MTFFFSNDIYLFFIIKHKNGNNITGIKYLPCIPSIKLCPTGVQVRYRPANTKTPIPKQIINIYTFCNLLKDISDFSKNAEKIKINKYIYTRMPLLFISKNPRLPPHS